MLPTPPTYPPPIHTHLSTPHVHARLPRGGLPFAPPVEPARPSPRGMGSGGEERLRRGIRNRSEPGNVSLGVAFVTFITRAFRHRIIVENVQLHDIAHLIRTL